MAVGAYGLPVKFEVTGGQVADCSVAPELIAQLPEAEAIVGNKGYDSGSIRQQIEGQGNQAVIPRRCNSVRGNDDLDRGLYRYRHLVENAFARLKQYCALEYRALAFRFDHYEGVVAMACALLWLPM